MSLGQLFLSDLILYLFKWFMALHGFVVHSCAKNTLVFLHCFFCFGDISVQKVKKFSLTDQEQREEIQVPRKLD
jgi:hypothetical protein